jgi:hypothetical protein
LPPLVAALAAIAFGFGYYYWMFLGITVRNAVAALTI